jgi:lipopolysaccharide biosynthesis regulator YciM
MKKILHYIEGLLPERFRSRRFPIGDYHYDLKILESDITRWLNRDPISLENVEIYYALAELFRSRGEFDKAISIHEAISAAQLAGHEPFKLEIEIARDYYLAGVLSHAESVLRRALEEADDETSKNAFRLWLSILEKEKDWEQAVNLIEKHGIPGSGGLRLANLYCEYAEDLLKVKNSTELSKVLKKARKLNVGTRATYMSAVLAIEQQRVGEATYYYRDVLEKDPLRANLAIRPLKQLAVASNSIDSMLVFLKQLYLRHPSVRVLEVVIELHQLSGEPLDAHWLAAIDENVHSGESMTVVQFWLTQFSDLPVELVTVLKSVLSNNNLEDKDVHLCTQCGYESDKMLWHCPQCEAWETLYSRYELDLARSLKNGS